MDVPSPQSKKYVVLRRHGQYDETFKVRYYHWMYCRMYHELLDILKSAIILKEDSKRKLTALGREQAHLTGARLAEMIKGIDDRFEACDVKEIRVSDMTRAKETASIIAEHLPKTVVRVKPDPLLNEGM